MLEHQSFFLQLLQDPSDICINVYRMHITLTSRFHKPDLFITMTANPKWSEIQDQVPTGISPQSHPDIVDHVSIRKRRS